MTLASLRVNTVTSCPAATSDAPVGARLLRCHPQRRRACARGYACSVRRRPLWQDVGVSEHSGYPGAPPGWYPDPAGGPGQRWWDGYAWTEATVLPQHPPPPPWAGAAAAAGAGLTGGAWAWRRERLSAFNTGKLVADELAMVPIGAHRRRDARRLLPREPDRGAGERRPAARRRPPVPSGLARRAKRHHAAALSRLERIQCRQPPRRRAHARRRCRGLRVAAPRRVGRPGPGDPLAPLPRLGRRLHGSCRSSTCGSRTPPSATACRRVTPTAHECCTGGSPGSSPRS